MNREFHLLIFFLLFAGAGDSLGQQIRHFNATEKKNSPEQNMALGNALYGSGEYYAASKLYMSVLEERTDDLDATYKLAQCHRQLREYQKASTLYQKVTASGDSRHGDAVYWYGVMLQSLGQYDGAMDQFRKATAGQVISADEILQRIKSCEFAKSVKSADDDIKVSLITYPNAAFGAFSSGEDEIFFTSVEEKIVRRKVDYDDQKGIYDTLYANSIFHANANGNAIINASALKIDVKEKDRSMGGASLSPDQNRIYFSVCNTLEGNTGCSIFTSVKEKNKWGDPEIMPSPINMPGYSTKHPMVIAEGSETVMFFASNRPGGLGGYDLWYARLSGDGSSGSPVNLGSIINTPGDEVTPFYDTDSYTMFFSSNGHVGLGQFDIYLVQLDKTRKNGTLVHLGAPINSSADDYYFTMFDHGRSGYLSSNRSSVYDRIYDVDFKDRFSYKRLDESMAELETFNENDTQLPLFRESFAYRALSAEDQALAEMNADDIAISGTLLADGLPGSNKTVMLLDGEGNVIDTTTADENGFFEFKPLPSDQQYSLMFQEKDAGMSIDVSYRNQSGEVLKSLNSLENPDFFRYKKLTAEGSGAGKLLVDDSGATLPVSDYKTLFKPAMTYADYQAVEDRYLDQIQGRINLRVQIGAYRHPSSRLFRNLKLDYPIERIVIGDVTKFLSGNFKKLAPAEAQRQRAYNQGVSDAFVAVYLDGKRIAILLYE